jgi:hypothetical protein
MASDFNLGSGFGNISGSLDGMTTFFIWLFTIIIVFGAVWLFIWYMSFKIKIRIRQHTNSGYYVIDTWARQYKTRKTGITKWRLLKPRQHIAPPVEGFIEITTKGRFSAECDRSIDGTIVWRKIAKNTGEVDVFTAEERTMLIQELREAESYKRKNWGEIVMALAPFITIILILVVFMIFFKETVQPTIDMANSIQGTAASMSLLGDKLEAVCLERPTLTGQNRSTAPPN